MKKYPHGLTLNAVCTAIDDYQRHEDSVPEEGILAAFNTLLGHSDIADELRSMERTADVNMAAAQAMRDEMYHWQQRAEAAEAKLAELEQQEPVAYVHPAYLQAGALGFDASLGRLAPAQIPLFTRPAPAADLAELVPEEMTWNQAHSLLDINQCGEDRFSAFMMGANSCRAAILRNIEDAK